MVSTLPGQRIGLALLHTLKHHDFPGQVALTSHNHRERDMLQKAGADLVLFPFQDAAKEAAQTLAELGVVESSEPG